MGVTGFKVALNVIFHLNRICDCVLELIQMQIKFGNDLTDVTKINTNIFPRYIILFSNANLFC